MTCPGDVPVTAKFSVCSCFTDLDHFEAVLNDESPLVHMERLLLRSQQLVLDFAASSNAFSSMPTCASDENICGSVSRSSKSFAFHSPCYALSTRSLEAELASSKLE